MKNGFFKKILALSLVVLMILTAVLATGCGKKDDDDDGKGGKAGKLDAAAGRDDFINSIGGVSETYKGGVSQMSYGSKEEAAEAFVANEIVGNQTATVSDIIFKKDLGDSEAAAIIPLELLTGGVQGVSQLEVTYSVYGDSSMKASKGYTNVDSLDTTRKVDVYVIKFEFDWKYFTPCPVTGETITRDYYDSVFNAEKYKNCTFVSTTKMNMDVSAGGQTQKVDCTITQTIKYADGKIYLTQVVTGDTDMLGLSNANIEAYMEEVDGVNKIYVKMGAESSWVEGNLYQIGFSSMDELTPFATSYLDYTYFTKTEFGFALPRDNAKKYFMAAFESLGASFSSMLDDMNIDMYAEYYVREGVLSGARTEANVDIEMDVSGTSASLKEYVNVVTTCTDYGTTVVNKPF